MSGRRMGSIDSAKAEAMLDAAEEILKEEGYAALTSRRVAEFLGVKQRLLYYYFRTMDDLVLESFRRLSRRELARLQSAVDSDKPLQEIWDICINTSDARLISEFMALANRHAGVREEVIDFIEASRKIQIAALRDALAGSDSPAAGLPADAIAVIGTSLALALNRESSLGIRLGHTAVNRVIRRFFDGLEL